MLKFNALLLLIVLFVSTEALACKCARPPLTDQFQHATFVAKVKFLNIEPDVTNADYHDARIGTLDLYKGIAVKTIKIHSQLRSSCSFLPAINSTWIIFAAEWQGKLTFHYCSGSLNVSDSFKKDMSTSGYTVFRYGTQVKQDVLEFFRANRITDPNPSNLSLRLPSLDSIRGPKKSNSFSVFKLNVNADLSVSKVISLKRFSNIKLHNAVLKQMKRAHLSPGIPAFKPSSGPTQVIVVVYFYPQSNKKNLVTLYNL